jgi:hypothetical protein
LQFHVLCAEQLRESSENVSVKYCGCADVKQATQTEKKPAKEPECQPALHKFKIGDEVAVVIDDEWHGALVTHLLKDGNIRVCAFTLLTLSLTA